MQKADTLLLIDGSSVLHRAQYPAEKLTLDNALIHVFLNMIVKILRDTGGVPKVFVMFDKGFSKYRTDINPRYKIWKSKPIEDPKLRDLRRNYSIARQEVTDFLNTIGITTILESGYEADDLIAYAQKRLNAEYERIIILTEDHDLLQLLDDKTIVFMPKVEKVYDKAQFIEEMALDKDDWINNFLFIKAVSGDHSDNIDGIDGLGEVNANRIFKEIKAGRSIEDFKNSTKKKDQAYAAGYGVVEGNLRLVNLHQYVVNNHDALEKIFNQYQNFARKRYFDGRQWLIDRKLQVVLSNFDVLYATSE